MARIIVSGLGNGMSCTIARDLISSGHTVATVSRGSIGKSISQNLGSWHISCDLTDLPSVEAAVTGIGIKWGGIDHLVHTAGGYFKKSGIMETDPHFFRSALINNAETFYNIVRSALPWMKKNAGSITVVSAARHVFINSNPGYAAGKGAVEFMVRELARELSHVGIRVNAVAPGFISKEGCGSSAFVEGLLANGRHSASQVAMTVSFLVKNTEITGQILEVDAGFSTNFQDGI